MSAEPLAPPAEVGDVDVVIIGSGFSGLGVAALLAEAKAASFVLLESADSLGGAWRDNTYPGCGCDIPAPLYSFSFDQKPDWTRLFATQPEILAYLQGVADRRGLTERIRFGARVDSARWSEQDRRWSVRTADGALYRARFVVSAVGPLHHPAMPELAGLHTFTGDAFHSARWRHDLDLTGKRVAVVGAGASAIQFVPAIAGRVASIDLYQRTPPWIVPKADRVFDARRRRLARWVPPYRWYVRDRLFWIHEKRAGGFLGRPGAMDATEALARRLLERQVPDAALRARLTPDYKIGCKRLLISSDWYPTLCQPHVTVHSGGVDAVEQDTVIGADGSATAVDVLIFGTGFDAQETVSRIDVVGRDGIRLRDAWADRTEAYLGTTVRGFPNFFTMVGPNTGLGHNSQVFMIEAQARYIVQCVRRLARRRATSLEPRGTAQRAYTAWLDRHMADTVWQSGGCRSWYQNARTRRNTVLWPDTCLTYWRKTRRVKLSDYDVV